MKILVIGSGGREHALAWKLSQGLKKNPSVHEIDVKPSSRIVFPQIGDAGPAFLL